MLHDVNFEDNDIVVDCGANIGELYLSIKKRENNILIIMGTNQVKKILEP